MKPERKSSRREFLTGGRVDSPENVTDSSAETAATNPGVMGEGDRSLHYLEHFSKHAMACEFELFFNMQQYSGSGTSALDAFGLIDELEEQLTVYRDSSEVSHLNRNASKDWVPVESGLFALLQRGLEVSRWTGGAFDMTSGELSRVWGFQQRQGRVPEEAEITSALAQVGYQGVELDPDQERVRFRQEGLQLNLGGIGKGYALDRATDRLVENGLQDFVLHGGQSSVIARGRETRQDAVAENGWNIGLSDPLIPGRRLAEIYLKDQALGTSGTGRQGFYFQGRRYGHIIDPRSGYPSDHCLSSTVIADSAADCDALATAFFLMTPEEVAAFCEQHPEYRAVLVLPDKRTRKIRVEAFNMDPDGWTLIDS
ncbi:MAG: FAD:protein FMN transferase [Planctomycetota bacterium]|nr:FAD:protein FMN transferase [Planctomycetota bacterium]